MIPIVRRIWVLAARIARCIVDVAGKINVQAVVLRPCSIGVVARGFRRDVVVPVPVRH
jgi:hypothetical protein